MMSAEFNTSISNTNIRHGWAACFYQTLAMESMVSGRKSILVSPGKCIVPNYP
uniref:Uncharacterized protein n=1 Tax=Ascaris lumbricoides TaxID=6252 RepID=A0A0M3HSY1_ASCLU